MIFDRTLQWSDGQAVTATTFSTNVVDLGKTGTIYGSSAPIARDVGLGEDVPLYIGVAQSFNNLTSLTISIEQAVDAAFTAPETVWTSPAYSLAQLTLGSRYLLPDSLPAGTNKRYVRLKYTVAGTAPTLGKITAGIVMSRQSRHSIA
jgi:hypothetical protein